MHVVSQNRPVVAAAAAASTPSAHRVIIVVISLWLLLLDATSAQEILTTQSLYEGIQAGIFDAILDVRSEDEWKTGHIENATRMADLEYATDLSLLEGCEACTLVVTCRSGHRAGKAIERLQKEYNFTGTLYNGMGISQWTMAGYPLVTTDSVTPRCKETCGLEQQQQQGQQAGLTDASQITMVPTSSTPAPRPVPNPNFSLTAPPTLLPPNDPTSGSPSLSPDPNEPAILSTPGAVDITPVMTSAQTASESSSSSSSQASMAYRASLAGICLLLLLTFTRNFGMI